MDLLTAYISFIGNLIFRVLEKIPGVNFCQVLKGPNDLKFILIPKCGTRSIRNAVLRHYEFPLTKKWRAWSFIHYMAKVDGNNSYTIFLRPPLERIHSCWKQKVSAQRNGSIFYFWQYYPIIRPDMDFGEFLLAVAKIPAPFREKHFTSVKYLINGADLGLCQFMPLVSLKTTLNKNFLEIVSSANTTTKSDISDSDANTFDQLLGADYSFDTELYQKAIASNDFSGLL